MINETVNNLTQAIRNQSTKDDDRTSGRGSGSFSLVSYADTELFYGRPNIELLASEAEHQLSKDLDNEPHHRTARVSEWLRQELEASYPFLEQAATPNRSGTLNANVDPLEELGDQVARRDFTRIAQIAGERQARSPGQADRRRATSIAVDNLSDRRKHVVSTLAFALQIQAAGVSRRLKQDMTDQDPTLNPEILKGLSFFEPEVSDEAFRAFEHYVTVKWPLRVYAIEPVIAQQNVADAFGQTKRSAFDLLGAAPIGPWKALAGIAADRRAADDETAIRLNPTMVGFGAGQSTFGWIFYPRLQTSGGSNGRLLTDVALLLNGRIPDPMRQRSEHRTRTARMHRADRNAQLRSQDRIRHRGQLVPHQRGGRRPEGGPGESVQPRPQAHRGRDRLEAKPRSSGTSIARRTTRS